MAIIVLKNSSAAAALKKNGSMQKSLRVAQYIKIQ